MQKTELREIYRQKRSHLTSEQTASYSLQMTNQVVKLPVWSFSFYHIFLTIAKNNEVDTEPLLSLLQGKDKHIVISKTFPQGVLKNYLLTDNTLLKINKWGIPEPQGGIEITEAQLEVVFVPLLVFDTNGHRVGYGGGYYDRLLKKCSPDTIKIGLSFYEPIDEIEDIELTDIPLDYCITPDTIYSF